MNGNRYRYGKRLYGIWIGMRARCNRKSHHAFHRYGGRGISVCKEWDDYEAFASWALQNGYAENLTIERNDVNGDYTPENCSWVTKSAQAKNRSRNHMVTVDGVTKTSAEWSVSAGLDRHTVYDRIKRGVSPDEAVKIPSRTGRKYIINGEEGTIAEIAERHGINRATLLSRIKRGISGDDLFSKPNKKVEVKPLV